jgi:hypothetical protein
MNDLASTLRLFGKLDEAVAKYWECHRLCIAKLGETHSTTLSSMDGLGLSLVLSGKPNDAAQLLRDCLALRQKTEPKGWRQFDTMSVLGGCLLAQKKHAEAEPLLLKGYEGMKAQETKIGFSEDRLGFTDAIERLIQLYREMGDAEAEARWRKELEASKAKTQQGGSID